MSRRRDLTLLLSLLTPAQLPRGRSTVLPPESPVLGLQPGVTARRAVLAPRLTTLPTQAFRPILPPPPTSAPALTFSLFREALLLLCEGHMHGSRPAPQPHPISLPRYTTSGACQRYSLTHSSRVESGTVTPPCSAFTLPKPPPWPLGSLGHCTHRPGRGNDDTIGSLQSFPASAKLETQTWCTGRSKCGEGGDDDHGNSPVDTLSARSADQTLLCGNSVY